MRMDSPPDGAAFENAAARRLVSLTAIIGRRGKCACRRAQIARSPPAAGAPLADGRAGRYMSGHARALPLLLRDARRRRPEALPQMRRAARGGAFRAVRPEHRAYGLRR